MRKVRYYDIAFGGFAGIAGSLAANDEYIAAGLAFICMMIVRILQRFMGVKE